MNMQDPQALLAELRSTERTGLVTCCIGEPLRRRLRLHVGHANRRTCSELNARQLRADPAGCCLDFLTDDEIDEIVTGPEYDIILEAVCQREADKLAERMGGQQDGE